MNTAEIRALASEEIASRLEDAREEYFKLRFQFATAKLTDYTRLRQIRREIARLATLLRERELAALLAARKEESQA
ncbi:MAG: 50S ribosomal protein L29 [Chloroflexi bacterium]|nr:50S ribosomal protein L29 [Chloroflexota bacterium]